MDIKHIVLLGVFGAIAVLSLLDYLSTRAFLKNGNGVEGNPLMALAMRYFPNYWPVVKLLMLPVCAGLWWLSSYSAVVALLAAGMTAGYLAVTVANNYQIVRNG